MLTRMLDVSALDVVGIPSRGAQPKGGDKPRPYIKRSRGVAPDR